MTVTLRLAVVGVALGVSLVACSGSGNPTAPTRDNRGRVIELSGNLAFGNVAVGSSNTKTLTIKNTGNETLKVSGIVPGNGRNARSFERTISASWTSGAAFTRVAGGTIASGASQAVTVKFTPRHAYAYDGFLTVTSDKTRGDNSIYASGTGTTSASTSTPSPTPSPSPTPTRVIGLSGNLAFGNVAVGSSDTKTLTIKNTGNSRLTYTNISTGLSVVTASRTSGSVKAGGSKTVTLTFSPVAAISYSGTVTVTSDKTSGTNTKAVSGTGTTSAPPPSPTPPPPPTPTPTPTGTYYVWGGPGYSVYLGNFSCMFCTEYGSESINNLYGTYGSKYSSTSIRNDYGQYGGAYSSFSPCNAYTENAPKVYNSNKTLYYGKLTVNRYASGYASSFYSWLVGDVCIS